MPPFASYVLTGVAAGGRIEESVQKIIRRTTQPVTWALTLAFTVVLVANCAAGRQMTQAEKDCCAAMGYDCHRGPEQHDCCSTESPRIDQLATAKVVSLAAPVAPVSLLPVMPYTSLRSGVRHATRSDRSFARPSRVPTYLLVSTLLI
jgi:hypothetical protein